MNIILLRGLMRESRHWGSFPRNLESLKNVGTVACLDFPGIGTEQKKIFYPVLKETVRDLRFRFQKHYKENLNQDWTILGISLGGMVAMEWAKMYPSDFKKIVLINTSSSTTGKLWERLRPESMLQVLKIFKESDFKKREVEIIKMVSNLKKNDATLIKEWADIARSSKFSKVTAVNQIIAASQFKLPVKLVPPALVLTSRADRMVHYKNSVAIAQKFKAELHIHPTAGHDLSIDDPDWCLEKIGSWL